MLKQVVAALALLGNLGWASVACGILGGLGAEVPANCPSGHMDAVPQPTQTPAPATVPASTTPPHTTPGMVTCPIDNKPMVIFEVRCGTAACFTSTITSAATVLMSL